MELMNNEDIYDDYQIHKYPTECKIDQDNVYTDL